MTQATTTSSNSTSQTSTSSPNSTSQASTSVVIPPSSTTQASTSVVLPPSSTTQTSTSADNVVVDNSHEFEELEDSLFATYNEAEEAIRRISEIAGFTVNVRYRNKNSSKICTSGRPQDLRIFHDEFTCFFNYLNSRRLRACTWCRSTNHPHFLCHNRVCAACKKIGHDAKQCMNKGEIPKYSKWTLDSGATTHLTHCIDDLGTWRSANGKKIFGFKGEGAEVTGIGTVKLQSGADRIITYLTRKNASLWAPSVRC